MNYEQALDKAERLMKSDKNLTAQVVRILPEEIDPADVDDNGWDVLVRVWDAAE